MQVKGTLERSKWTLSGELVVLQVHTQPTWWWQTTTITTAVHTQSDVLDIVDRLVTLFVLGTFCAPQLLWLTRFPSHARPIQCQNGHDQALSTLCAETLDNFGG